jgi:mRNA interferase RelE/StbE
MAYSIEILPRAQKAIRKLPADVRAGVIAKIDALADDPRPHGSKKLVDSEHLYRVRSGDYRIIYEIADQVLRVAVVNVGHRRDIYR